MDNEIQTTSQNTGIANFTKIETVIGDLVRGIAATEFDVSTGKGMREACEVRLQIRTARINLGKAGKTAKRNLNTEKKRIDSEVDRLTALAYTGETPLHDMIRAEEDRKADEKRLREEAELERKGKIQTTIQGIADLPGKCAHGTAEDLKGAVEYLESYEIGGFFAEYTGQARATQAASLSAIKAVLDSRLARDKEDAERAAEAARLADQKRIQDERQAKMDAEQAEIDEARKQQEAQNVLEAPTDTGAEAEKETDAGDIGTGEDAVTAAETRPDRHTAETTPAVPVSTDSDNEPEWVPVVRRLKKDVLRDILNIADGIGFNDSEARSRIAATCMANLKAVK